MKRIYLKPHKKKANKMWIKDIIDDKKLGHFDLKKNAIHLKAKHQNKDIENETHFILKENKMGWNDFLWHKLKSINKDLWDIDNHYSLPFFIESCRLKKCSTDMFGRQVYLHPAAKKAWKKMKKAAYQDNIDIQIISAFRSINYQKTLIENKLNKGQNINDIIKVSALPGFSEHHTGLAIDIGSKGASILEEDFDQCSAFLWLKSHARRFGFKMSYPKNNDLGIIYEPWHWCYKSF